MQSRDPVLGLTAGELGCRRASQHGGGGARRREGKGKAWWEGAGTAELQAGQWALHKGAERGGAQAQRGQVSVPTRTNGNSRPAPGLHPLPPNTGHEALGENEENTTIPALWTPSLAAEIHSLHLNHVQKLDSFSKAQNDQDGKSLITG